MSKDARTALQPAKSSALPGLAKTGWSFIIGDLYAGNAALRPRLRHRARRGKGQQMAAPKNTSRGRLRSRDWWDNPDNPGMTAMYLERYLNFGLTLEEL